MRRPLTALALAALGIAVALVWLQGGKSGVPEPVAPAPAGAATAEPTPVESRSDSEPPRSQVAASDPDPASPTSPAATPPASWTGLRVRTVSKETGAPIAGVPVHASSPGVRTTIRDVPGSRGTIAEIPRTDADGQAELVLDPGFTGEVRARGLPGLAGSGEVEITTPLSAGEVRAVELALPTARELVLHGRVVDRETGAPIPGAAVGPAESLGKIRADAEQHTDAGGRFRFEGGAWERVVVQVLALGYEPAATRLAAGHADPARPLEFALSRVASVRVTLTDAGGAPQAGTELRLATDAYRFGRPDGMGLIDAGWTHDVLYRATTDAAGRALFPEIPPRMPLAGTVVEGRAVVFHAPEELVLEPGELREVAWRVGAGCAIHGLALEESGAPAADLPIALQRARFPAATLFEPHAPDDRRLARTDASGRFEFADAAPGAWWLGPGTKSGGRSAPTSPEAAAPVAQLVEIAPGATRADVTVRVARGHAIRGRLLDPDGRPAAHGFVEIASPDGAFHAQQDLDARGGEFALGPLHPGEYVLTASSIGDHVDALPVTAYTGQTDVVLQFRRGGAIAGVVVGSDGKPVARADVLVNARVPGRFGNLSSWADADGRFRFDGLVPGLHDVAARSANGEVGVATAVDVVEGREPTEVRIETAPGARVRVRYAGPDPHVGVSVLQRGVTIVADGLETRTERTFPAPTGAVTVRVTRYPGPAEFDLPLTLAAGETRDLVFEDGWR